MPLYPTHRKKIAVALISASMMWIIIRQPEATNFLPCYKKIIIVCVAPGKMDNFRNCQKLLNQKISSGEGCIYLMRTGKPHTFHSISGRSPIVLRKVPLIQNPFRIEKELFPVLQELLD